MKFSRIVLFVSLAIQTPLMHAMLRQAQKVTPTARRAPVQSAAQAVRKPSLWERAKSLKSYLTQKSAYHTSALLQKSEKPLENKSYLRSAFDWKRILSLKSPYVTLASDGKEYKPLRHDLDRAGRLTTLLYFSDDVDLKNKRDEILDVFNEIERSETKSNYFAKIAEAGIGKDDPRFNNLYLSIELPETFSNFDKIANYTPRNILEGILQSHYKNDPKAVEYAANLFFNYLTRGQQAEMLPRIIKSGFTKINDRFRSIYTDINVFDFPTSPKEGQELLKVIVEHEKNNPDAWKFITGTQDKFPNAGRVKTNSSKREDL